MQFRRIITKLGGIPHNAILLLLMILTPYTNYGNYLHDRYLIELGYMPLALKLVMMLCITVFCAYVIGFFIKWIYYKPRPIPYPRTTLLEKIDASSFPSMHTAITCILAYYGIRIAYIFTAGGVEYFLITLRIFLFVSIAVSRVILRKHYRSDVVVGFLFGVMCIYLSRYCYSIIF